MINWINVESTTQIIQLIEQSKSIPCAIFKHSTRCHLSAMAKFRLESEWNLSADVVNMYLIDIITHRAISNEVTEVFSEFHESPQLLLIRNGDCTFAASKWEITIEELNEALEEINLDGLDFRMNRI